MARRWPWEITRRWSPAKERIALITYQRGRKQKSVNSREETEKGLGAEEGTATETDKRSKSESEREHRQEIEIRERERYVPQKMMQRKLYSLQVAP
jgi:hypothetical protein